MLENNYMARPKKIPLEQSEPVVQDTPLTEQVPAPATPPPYIPQWVPPPQPRQMQVERIGNTGAAVSRRFPEVRGGICEWCGVLDPNVPSQFQYKLCPHYRGMQLSCSYCPATADPDDVVMHEKLLVAEHPDNPNKLIVWCGRFECSKKHLERFQLNA